MNLEQLQQYRQEILELAQQYHSGNVRVFGSVARGEAMETSDVDFIVDLTPEQDLFDFIRFSRSLEELLGCKVDVVHSSALHDSIRSPVLKEANQRIGRWGTSQLCNNIIFLGSGRNSPPRRG